MCISRSCEVRFVCRSAHIAAQRHLVIVALLSLRKNQDHEQNVPTCIRNPV